MNEKESRKAFVIWFAVIVIIIGVGVLINLDKLWNNEVSADKKPTNTHTETGEPVVESSNIPTENPEIDKSKSPDKNKVAEEEEEDEQKKLNDNLNKKIEITGTVKSKYEDKKGNVFITILTLTDDKILVPIFENTSIIVTNIKDGSYISVSGILQKYKNDYEIIPEQQQDIKLISYIKQNDTQIRTVESIDIKCDKENVVICGYLKQISESKGNYFFRIEDSTGTIECVLFKKDVESNIHLMQQVVNNNIEVMLYGRVNLYNQSIQIIVNKIEESKEIQ